MNHGSWQELVNDLARLLGECSFRDEAGAALTADEAFGRWGDMTMEARRTGGVVYLVGNGASASLASHLAADLAKNAQLHTQVFSDLSLITAISNDVGYESVFAEPLRRRASEGDMLVAISSSGCSPNILRAVDVAREQRLGIITLSAMAPGNPLRSSGHINIYVAGETYGHAETCHAAVLHHWMDRVQAAVTEA